MDWDSADYRGRDSGRRDAGANYQRAAGAFAMKWIVVGIIAACNRLGDVLNTAGMKRQGEVEDLSPGSLARMVRRIFRNTLVLGGFAALAVSFFALLSLLSITNVSFAVPATAISYLLETLLAKYILGEDVRWRRWAAASLVACGVLVLFFYIYRVMCVGACPPPAPRADPPRC